MSRRKIPVAADVRAALADARRARAAARKAAPAAVTGVAWQSVTATCRFCGEDGGAARAGEVVVCARTLAEMTALPPAPEGDDVESLLAILERWMAARPGEPEVPPWPASGDRCGACGRSANDVAALFAADEIALCFDCAWRAAEGRVDEAARAAVVAAEAEQALAELENLARIRAEVKNDPALRGNATAVLSLLRILGLPDGRTRARISELVRSLDAS